VSRGKQNIDWSDLESLAASHTVTDIAEIKKCTPGSVRRELRKAELKAKDKNEEFHQKIRELHTEKQMSAYEIAKLLHRPRVTIDKFLRDSHLSRNRRKAGKLAYERWLRHTFVCHICHQRKDESELRQSMRFRYLFGCRECIEKNDCILGRISPPAQPGEKVPFNIPAPRVYRIIRPT